MKVSRMRVHVWFFAVFSLVTDGIAALCWITGDGLLEDRLILLFAAVVLGIVTVCIGRRFAVITMTHDGVTMRPFFKAYSFSWETFIQAGALYRASVVGQTPGDLVLLLPGGQKRTFDDLNFTFRNFSKLIWLIDKPDIREFVIVHYGPLDFDASHGWEKRK